MKRSKRFLIASIGINLFGWSALTWDSAHISAGFMVVISMASLVAYAGLRLKHL